MLEPREFVTSEMASSLDQRLTRLEAVVTALQDTQLMEDRVADRVVQRIKRASLKTIRGSTDVVLDSAQSLAPAAYDDNGRPTHGSYPSPPAPEPPTWILWGLWTEVRTFGQMLFDHRYPFSFSGRFGPLLIAFAYVFCWFFVSGMPIIGPFLERFIDIVLAILLYKIIYRETRRYRAMFPA